MAPDAVASTDEGTWDDIQDINLEGAFFITPYAPRALRASKGKIVDIASVSGLAGEADATAYCVSEAGLIRMTRCNAVERAPDFRVDAVCLGAIDTAMLRRGADFWSGSVEEGYKMLSDHAMLKRVGHVRDVAGPVLHLASDLANLVTGGVHVVDGGMTIDQPDASLVAAPTPPTILRTMIPDLDIWRAAQPRRSAATATRESRRACGHHSERS
jgi:NAD(P)-dependent dehydrogenase (short-subunit alcohol dehydrogenase family)